MERLGAFLRGIRHCPPPRPMMKNLERREVFPAISPQSREVPGGKRVLRSVVPSSGTVPQRLRLPLYRLYPAPPFQRRVLRVLLHLPVQHWASVYLL